MITMTKQLTVKDETNPLIMTDSDRKSDSNSDFKHLTGEESELLMMTDSDKNNDFTADRGREKPLMTVTKRVRATVTYSS